MSNENKKHYLLAGIRADGKLIQDVAFGESLEEALDEVFGDYEMSEEPIQWCELKGPIVEAGKSARPQPQLGRDWLIRPIVKPDGFSQMEIVAAPDSKLFATDGEAARYVCDNAHLEQCSRSLAEVGKNYMNNALSKRSLKRARQA